MTYTILATKNGQSVQTLRINTESAVGKARELMSFGWQVHIRDSAGEMVLPEDFDQLLLQKLATSKSAPLG